MCYASSRYHYFALTLHDVADGNSALCLVLEEGVGVFLLTSDVPSLEMFKARLEL